MVLLVGSGNNGGDALFAGAFLRRRGLAVTAIVTDVDKAHLGGLAALLHARGRVVTADDSPWQRSSRAADVIVDGLVGLSAKPPLRPPADDLVGMANATDALRVAVDLPSGIEPDTGLVRGIAFLADVTVTFGGIKTGLLIADEQIGTIVCEPIGMDMTDVRRTLIAMTDGAVRAAAAGPGRPSRTSSPAAWSASSPDRPATPARAVLCIGGAVRTRPGMVRYAGRAGGRRARPLARGGGRRRPAAGRRGAGLGRRSGHGHRRSRPRPGCAGCSTRTSRCWSTRTG